MANAVYAFSAADNAGFVLVAADDRAHSILGYSLTGSFSYENLPPQLDAMLRGYALQIAAAEQTGKAVIPSDYSDLAQPESRKAVAPLLGNIAWNQDAPFNDLCPIDRTYQQRTPAGCVATAMAQIMKYWGYPRQGIGSRSYLTESQFLSVSANFGAANYEWEKMLADYNGNYTAEQGAEVAELLYHVGVACKMDYLYEGSGAVAKEAANGLKRYFGYDSNLEYYDRTHFDTPSWDALLRSELDAGRPVLHFGEGTAGGHAFVCDGYDTNGLFHINWGWGGASDGFFRSTALDPEILGIGSGGGAYNYLQSVMTNIQPPSETSTHVAGLQLSKALVPAAESTERSAETSINAAFYNFGLRNFTGEVAVALYDATDRLVATLASRKLNALRELVGGTPSTDFLFSIPAELAAGTYTLYLVHREEGAAEYTRMLAPAVTTNRLIVNVTDTRVTYARPAHKAALSLTAKPVLLTPFHTDRPAQFSVTVRNDGEEYYSYLGIRLQRRFSVGEKIRQDIGVILTRIPKGETRTFTYSTDKITVPAGQYDIVAIHDIHNTSGGTPEGIQYYFDAIGPDEMMVTQATLKSAPFLPAQFSMTAPLTITADDGSNVAKRNELFTITTRVTNNGGYGDRNYALIFVNRQEEVLENTSIINVIADSKEEKELKFTHRLNREPGQYGIILAEVSGSNATAVESEYNGLVFNLTAPTGIHDVNADQSARLAVTSTDAGLQVSAPETIRQLTVMTTDGRTVLTKRPGTSTFTVPTDALPAGLYLITAQTADGILSTKVTIRP